jgi:hypothetical protein
MRRGSPGGVNASPTEASASPYTGAMQLRRRLHLANRSSNALMVSGLTGSAPLNAKRHEERSIPSSSSSWMRRRQSS